MKEYKLTRIVRDHEIYTETAVGCNKCGKTTQLTGEEYEQEWTKEEYPEFHLSFGYGSSYDSETWQFNLCEDCLTELVKTFKRIPTGFGEGGGYFAHHPQAMFEEWKGTGIVNFEAGMTPEEIEANGGSIYSNNEEEEHE